MLMPQSRIGNVFSWDLGFYYRLGTYDERVGVCSAFDDLFRVRVL